jgi:hypothetical protein
MQLLLSLHRSLDQHNRLRSSRLKSAGTTSRSTEYAYFDDQPFDGASYYRFKQTDFNGTYTYFDVVSGACKAGDGSSTANMYESDAGEVTVLVNSENADDYILTIYDMNNRTTAIEQSLVEEGYNTVQFNAHKLATGIHLVNCQNGATAISQRIFMR